MSSGSRSIPTAVGPYTIERELGKGNYGVVYLAQRGPGLPLVALKVLLAPGDADASARFQRESVLAAQLNHPNVVGAVETGFHGHHPWVATEYVAGETLRARMRRDPLTPRESRRVICEIAAGLDHAHALGVVHRDLKPGNIILSELGGHARIVDFGLAHDDRSSGLTRTGDVIGSPYYMAPEQILDSKRVDARTDIYALGVILYQCLSGRRPYEGNAIHEVFTAIRRGRPTPLRKLAPDAPEDLVAVCEQAMAHTPEDRFASAKDLIAALEGGAPAGPKLQSNPGLVAALIAVPALFVLAAITFLVATRTDPTPSAAATPVTPPPSGAEARAKALGPAPPPRAYLDAETATLPELEAFQPDGSEADRDALAGALLERARKRAAKHARLPELNRLVAQAERIAGSRAARSKAQLARATYAFRRGRFEEATRLARRIDATGRTKFQARYVAAYGQLWQDRFETALPALERIWKDDPEGVVGQNAGAVFNSHTGKNDVGEKLALAALKIDPLYVDAYCSLAFCRNDLSHKIPDRRQELLELSLKASSRAIELAPDHPRPYMARAFALGNLGRGEESIRAYGEVIRLTAPLPMARVLRFRAQRLLVKRDYVGALADLNLALKRDPRDAESLVWRGVLREQQGDTGAAERDWINALAAGERGVSRALGRMPRNLRRRILGVLRRSRRPR